MVRRVPAPGVGLTCDLEPRIILDYCNAGVHIALPMDSAFPPE
jgi:hypothetical protein